MVKRNCSIEKEKRNKKRQREKNRNHSVYPLIVEKLLRSLQISKENKAYPFPIQKILQRFQFQALVRGKRIIEGKEIERKKKKKKRKKIRATGETEALSKHTQLSGPMNFTLTNVLSPKSPLYRESKFLSRVWIPNLKRRHSTGFRTIILHEVSQNSKLDR